MSEDLGNPNEPLEEVHDANLVEEALGVSSITENNAEVRYTIINAVDVESIDFSRLQTTNEETARKNNDETKIVLKFLGEVPDEISTLNTTIYTIDEIRSVLTEEEWVPAEPDPASV